MQIKIEFTAKLPYRLVKRKKWIVASCPVLDVHSQGETEEQAKKNLVEALSLFLISCYERGTLDSILNECGFRAVHSEKLSSIKTTSQPSGDYITVPLPFVINSTRSSNPCHA